MTSSDPSVTIDDLRTEDDSGLIACGFAAPRLSWRLRTERSGAMQRAYEIAVATDAHFREECVSSGVIEAHQPFLAPWPGAPLASRAQRYWRVRVLSDVGWTGWSETARVEATLLAHDDWQARPISPVSNHRRPDRRSVALLRREFTLPQPCVKARLYVTALGLHDVHINGRKVGADLLEPGWTVYPHRLLFASYDVTALLRTGRNAISSALGDGWWRGTLTWMERRAIYGSTTALLAQLEMEAPDGSRTVVATDEGWRGSEGSQRMAEIYDGIDVDLRLEQEGWRSPHFDDHSWEPVTVLALPPGLEPRTMPGVQAVAIIDPVEIRRDGNRLLVDTGQNLAGYLRLTVRGTRGELVAVRHAEILDNRGELYTAPLRGARATDRYLLGDEASVVLEPSFTFHGFRYAEIEASAGVAIESIEVVAIGSALDYSGEFRCSDERVNRLFRSIVWSQRSNFLAIPTDCPQRDERLGWTGDIQVFCETACMNADCRTFLESWLKDLALEQRLDGCVASIAPNVIQGHEYEFGGAGWGDAAALVPWRVFEAFGDAGVLSRQYDSMCRWVDYCASRRNDDGVWVGDLQLGDWLDPGAPPDQPQLATTDSDFVATAYLSYSAGRVARAARVLGRPNDHARYLSLSDEVAAAAWRRWGSTAVRTQTGCALAIELGIAPRELHAGIGAALAELVVRNGARIATGFLGTPLVFPALARTGQIEAAYSLLLNGNCPGWLFQIDHGATTTWERWDAIRADGTLHEGTLREHSATMISYNHYAYGAIGASLYRSVAGLAPHPDDPGYGRILFAPQPGGGLTSASAKIMTPYGRAVIEWTVRDVALTVSIEIPAGASGEFHPPSGYRLSDSNASRSLPSGRHQLSLSRCPMLSREYLNGC